MAQLVTVVIPAHMVEVPARELQIAVADDTQPNLPDPPDPPDPIPAPIPTPTPLPTAILAEDFSDKDLTARGWLEAANWPFVTDDDLGASRLVLHQRFSEGSKTPDGTKWAARKLMSAHVAEFTHVIKIKPMLFIEDDGFHFFGSINDMDMADNGTAINSPYLAVSSGRWYMDLNVGRAPDPGRRYCGSLNANHPTVNGCKWPKFPSPDGAVRLLVWNQIVTHFKHNSVDASDGIYRTSVRYLTAKDTWSPWTEIIRVQFGNFIGQSNKNSKQSWMTIEGFHKETHYPADFRLADLRVYPGNQYEAYKAAPA